MLIHTNTHSPSPSECYLRASSPSWQHLHLNSGFLAIFLVEYQGLKWCLYPSMDSFNKTRLHTLHRSVLCFLPRTHTHTHLYTDPQHADVHFSVRRTVSRGQAVLHAPQFPFSWTQFFKTFLTYMVDHAWVVSLSVYLAQTSHEVNTQNEFILLRMVSRWGIYLWR